DRARGLAVRHAARVERYAGDRRSRSGTDRSFAHRGARVAEAEPRGATVSVIGWIVRPPCIRISQLLYALRAGRAAWLRDSCAAAVVCTFRALINSMRCGHGICFAGAG